MVPLPMWHLNCPPPIYVERRFESRVGNMLSVRQYYNIIRTLVFDPMIV
jgi:hypothetical protein